MATDCACIRGSKAGITLWQNDGVGGVCAAQWKSAHLPIKKSLVQIPPGTFSLP